MAYAHVGHDCLIGDEVVITNLAQLAGHVTVERKVVVSGMVGCTQFVRLGELSFLTAGTLVNKDVAPYSIADGRWASLRAVNRVGLQRAGLDANEIRNISRALRILMNNSFTMEEVTKKIVDECLPSPSVDHLMNFVRASEKGILRG